MKPVVAIVGRPNVGKSTLFNRIIRKRKAIVEDIPGVTRDRNFEETEYSGKSFVVVDTGGFDPDADQGIFSVMKQQVHLAIDEADSIIFLTDGSEGFNPVDKTIAELLRKCGKKIFCTVNKVDNRQREWNLSEFYASGLGEIYPVSAVHGYGVAELLEEIVKPFPEDKDQICSASDDINVAVVGRPNAGKSTLINRLLGENRLLVDDAPGTTRDSIDTDLKHGGKTYTFIDTAGIRRKSRITERVEIFSVLRAFDSIGRSDIVLIMLDASTEIAEQDARIASFVVEKGRGSIIIVNKWDLVEKDTWTTNEYSRIIQKNLPFIAHSPALFVSAKTGQRINKIFPLIEQVNENLRKRISTSQINKFYREVIERHPPPSCGNKIVKIYYLSQTGIKPPEIVAFTNNPKGIIASYERYLKNQLRKEFCFNGVPIRLKFKKRG
jgi:GTP-binding protein